LIDISIGSNKTYSLYSYQLPGDLTEDNGLNLAPVPL